MNNFKRGILLISSLLLIFAIKNHYGGSITVRLNEPASFNFTPSNFSNMIFYSLIYENFFFLNKNGDITSNIFDTYHYNKQKKILVLQLKSNLSFSNGSPITPENIRVSLRFFLNLNLVTSRKLAKIVKSVNASPKAGLVYLELLYDEPGIISLLTSPELVLQSDSNKGFSGLFYPTEWVKGKYIQLEPNPFYAGGRTYLDSVRVIFYDYYYPDVFISDPGLREAGFTEANAGIYQNIYLNYPDPKTSYNTKVALFSLLREFFSSIDAESSLNSLTSDQESPISLNIKKFSQRKTRSILRYSKIKLFLLSSLNRYENKLLEFLNKKGIRIELIFLSNNEISNYLENTSIKYLLIEKVFRRQTSVAEKVNRILQEMSFSRFNEEYLRLINELNEVKFIKNEELLVEQVARIIEKIISDGFLLPLHQKKYSLYLTKKITGVSFDYYEKPVFHKVRLK